MTSTDRSNSAEAFRIAALSAAAAELERELSALNGANLSLEDRLALSDVKARLAQAGAPAKHGESTLGQQAASAAAGMHSSLPFAAPAVPPAMGERLPFGTWELDFCADPTAPRGTLRWSDEMFRIAGFIPRSVEVSPQFFYELVHPDDRETVRAAVAEATRNQTDYSTIHRLIRPDGAVRVVHETAHLFFDGAGKLIRMFGAAHDLTEQRETEQRFRQLAEHIEEVFWLSTADHRQLLYVSPSYEAIWGRPLADLYANPAIWIESIHEADRERVRKAMARQPEGGYAEEYRVVLPDGSERWISDRAFAIPDAAGQVYRVAGVALDVTKRKQMELALARSNRALQLLTACHECLIRASDERALIQEICNLAVRMGGYRMAWVGYAANDAARTIEPKVWAGIEEGYLSEITLSWSEEKPAGRGPAAEAIRSGKTILCENLECDGFYWKDAAAARGYRHVVCLPLLGESKAFGVLVLYSGETLPPASSELKLLQDLADDLAFGIATVRSRLARQRTENTVLKLADSVSAKAGAEFLATLTQNMVDALQAKGGVIGKLQPHDRRMIATLSFYVDGKFLDNLTYAVSATPCEGVVAGVPTLHERGLQESFPEDHMLVQLGLHAYAGIPLFTPQGEVTGLMAVFFDHPITEGDFILSTLKIFATRAGAEIQRQEADARIRAQASLLDKARDAILTRDLDHRITYWNKSAERLYGWTAEEALGRPINRLLYADEAPFHAAMATLLSTGEWAGELLQVNKNGEPLTVECRWTLVSDANGKPHGVLAINTDVTERKRLESQFLRAQRMESIGTLAGGIAHDLNNVLAPILMSIELLRDPVDPATSQRILDTLEASATRGADLVRQVLLFARGLQGQRVQLDPGTVVMEVEKMLRETFPKSIMATIERMPGVHPVHGDPTQLHQVLVNLCVNARDAMPAGGELAISLDNRAVTPSEALRFGREAKPGKYARITVRDSGCGMPDSILDKVFEPFFTTKPVGSGTGLGLSTTLAIVRSHGGFIHVESDLGRGTKFEVYLPACTDTRHEAAASKQASIPRGKGELILVVDDEDAMRALARNVLETFGYRVALASNGLEGLDYYRQHSDTVDLVLTDMAMPVMDGPTLIRALRELRPDLPIMGSSGLSTRAAIAATIGSDLLFLPKPYTAASLLEGIRSALASR